MSRNNKPPTDAEARAVMRAANFEPDARIPYRSARAPWPGRCMNPLCGAEGAPSYWNVLNGQGPCTECGKRNRGMTQKERKSAVASARAKILNFLPSVPYEAVGSRSRWPGVCLICQQPIAPWPTSLKSGQGACAYCAGKRVDTAVAAGKMMARDFLPLVPFPGSLKHWRGICLQCGNINAPTYSDVVLGGDGACPTCAKSGFDPAKDAYMYFMRREHNGVIEAQIGITNVPADRLRTHRTRGWVLVGDLLGPIDGYCARDHLERDARTHLRLQGLQLSGTRENWELSAWPVSSLDQILQLVEHLTTECPAGEACYRRSLSQRFPSIR